MPASKSKKAVALRNEKAELLKDAVVSGDLDKVKDLVKNGANVNKFAISDYDQYYPLENAARKGHAECMRFLIDNGAKLNPRKKRGQMVLLLAAASGNPECLQVLSDEGMDVDERGEDDETALMWAVREGERNIECIKIILQQNADVDCQDYRGLTALYLAAEKNQSEIVQLLLSNNPSANTELGKKSGETPLGIACEKGHTRIVKILAEHGANVNAKMRPLSLAVLGGHLSCIEILFNHGVDPNLTLSQGCSALSSAIEFSTIDVIEDLLKRGINVNLYIREEQDIFNINIRYMAMNVLLRSIMDRHSKKSIPCLLNILKLLLKYGGTMDLCILGDNGWIQFLENSKNVKLVGLTMATCCIKCVESLHSVAVGVFENDQEAVGTLETFYNRNISLESQATKLIRRLVYLSGIPRQTKNFVEKVNMLPLPEDIKKCLLLENLKSLIDDISITK